MKTRSASVVTGVLLAVAALAGCATQSGSEANDTFDALVDEAIADAESNGATPSQLSLLTDAQERGHMPVDSARAAIEATVSPGRA
ncbi:hypothetical protein [Demequina sediminicola]|uniref:hypothetical protein n=1 Tax=Demequina sediminicola TaxID=1095026 RepID=UPI00078123B6|nr:hypothetical protein [Demequina sediminicola]